MKTLRRKGGHDARIIRVDDVVSCIEGTNNQEKIFQRIDEFACKHKLEWGQEKWKVMQVGKIKDKREKWKLGGMEIENWKHGNINTAASSDILVANTSTIANNSSLIIGP